MYNTILNENFFEENEKNSRELAKKKKKVLKLMRTYLKKKKKILKVRMNPKLRKKKSRKNQKAKRSQINK